MTRRIKLHVDTLVHINDVVFEVFRSNVPGVDETKEHVMTLDDRLTIKQRYTETAEILSRDPYTPYALIAKRHFEVEPFPKVYIGSTPVLAKDILLFPDDKTVEIHSGDLGLFDGRTIYMDYEYKSTPITDDNTTESGKTYIGPPATGLRNPLNFSMVQDFIDNKIHLSFTPNTEPFVYFYRIYARDTDGNLSPWSDESYVSLVPSEVFFRIQRSADEDQWEEVSYSNMEEWFDEVKAINQPKSVHGISTIPTDSKTATLIFDNPWYHYKTEARVSYKYRVRAEDSDGYFTDWLLLNPIILYIQPQELLIRRKRNNGMVSSKTGIDAIDVFTLHAEDVDATQPTITLMDDQLTDATEYAYTFFLEDKLGMNANPVFSTSDHRPWSNIILFSNEKHTEVSTDIDFITTFELADRIIEIGKEV